MPSVNKQVAKIETITPQLAQLWLSKNPDNRNLSQSQVDRLTKDMREGKFVYNGESIVLDEEGALMDGQHRLMAIVLSGTPQRMLVAKGVPRAAMRTIDRGEARTVADWLKIRGFTNYTTCAQAAHILYAFEDGALHRIGSTGRFHPSDADAILARHPDLVNSVTVSRSLRETIGVVYNSVGTVAFLHYIFSVVDKAKADDFFTKMATGVDLHKESPIRHLRNLLIVNNQDKRKKMRPIVRVAFILKAWAFFYKNKPVKHLKYNEEEAFPLVAGFRYVNGKPVFPQSV